jgi:endoglucanase Acf2
MLLLLLFPAPPGNTVLEAWGRLLLAKEVTAARKYTQVYRGNDLYTQIANNSTANGITKAKVATILFAAKASSFNWFDPDMLTRHAIQWMPFTTSGSPLLLPAAWISEAWPMVAATTKMPVDRWGVPEFGIFVTLLQHCNNLQHCICSNHEDAC